jgi:hypothetical protein
MTWIHKVYLDLNRSECIYMIPETRRDSLNLAFNICCSLRTSNFEYSEVIELLKRILIDR